MIRCPCQNKCCSRQNNEVCVALELICVHDGQDLAADCYLTSATPHQDAGWLDEHLYATLARLLP